jgi:alcohol dehydrogenase (cytochrome c)
MSWRAQIYLLKSFGKVPELTWPELLQTTLHRGDGFSLKEVITLGQSVNGALSNPYTSSEDLETGGQIFRARCAECHGPNGRGSIGPSLVRSGFKNGDSDLAIYRVLTDGVAGSPMSPTKLSFAERWQVIGYIRNLQRHPDDVHDQIRQLNIQISSQQIKWADGEFDKWLSYSGSLNGWRYSPLTEITLANVSQLRVRWVHQFDTTESKFESTPLVVGGVIFITEPPASVVALDVKTGGVVWKFERAIPADLPICCGKVNRGLAILGDTLFFGCIDGYLVAINANTGKVSWQTRVANSSQGYSLTGAPLVVNNFVVIGVSGGEFGIRGFLAAYNPTTGEQQWKFDTIPGPGEPGHESWQNEAWKNGGGATWVTGSYDPSLDLLYWGVGNPAPPFAGDGRPGDNLFTNSVIALHASSGKLVWYFQFTPHDEHDWDSTQTPILSDLLIGGIERKVICWPNRNGFYYVLDRVTGQFLSGTPFVEIDWAQGLTAQGRPIPEANTVRSGGRVTKPSVAGGNTWQPNAFNPERGLIFVHALEGESVFVKSAPDRIVRGQNGWFPGSGGSILSLTHWVRALDAATGAKRWEYRPPLAGGVDFGGLLATRSGLVFGTAEGGLFALDAATGKELWHVSLGDTHAPPISFTVDGQQVIAVLAGRAMFLFGL